MRGALHCGVLNTCEILNPLFPALDTYSSCECPGRKEGRNQNHRFRFSLVLPLCPDLTWCNSPFSCKEQSFYFTSFQTICYLQRFMTSLIHQEISGSRDRELETGTDSQICNIPRESSPSHKCIPKIYSRKLTDTCTTIAQSPNKNTTNCCYPKVRLLTQSHPPHCCLLCF